MSYTQQVDLSKTVEPSSEPFKLVNLAYNGYAFVDPEGEILLQIGGPDHGNHGKWVATLAEPADRGYYIKNVANNAFVNAEGDTLAARAGNSPEIFIFKPTRDNAWEIGSGEYDLDVVLDDPSTKVAPVTLVSPPVTQNARWAISRD